MPDDNWSRLQTAIVVMIGIVLIIYLLILWHIQADWLYN